MLDFKLVSKKIPSKLETNFPFNYVNATPCRVALIACDSVCSSIQTHHREAQLTFNAVEHYA